MMIITTSILISMASYFLIPSHNGMKKWRPSFIFSASIFLSLLVNSIFFGTDNIRDEVIILYLSGCMAFVFGDMISNFIYPISYKENSVNVLRKFSIDSPIKKIYLAVGFLGLMVSFYLFYSRGLSSELPIGVALRYAHVYSEDSDYGAFHMLLFSQVIASILIINDEPKLRKVGYFLLLFSLFGSIVKMERTSILMLFCSIAFLSSYRKKSTKHLILPALALIGVFIALGIVTNKFLYMGQNFVWSYLGYGIHSFNDVLYNKKILDAGRNTFGIIANPLLGHINDRNFGMTMGDFNVFTYLHYPYLDFGCIGVILICALFGILWGSVFNNINKSPIALLMYSWMIYPCVMVFYSWQFSLTTFIYLYILYYLIIRWKKSVKIPDSPQDRPNLCDPSRSLS